MLYHAVHLCILLKLLSGVGVGCLPAQGLRSEIVYLQQLAEQGNVDAQFTLGLMYHRGDGIIWNNVQACKWISLAWMHAPVENAEGYQNTLETIQKSMTPGEISVARQFIQAWRVQR